ncbi:hypothetical protein Dimus_001984 [Dionaea muscipula]
MAKRGHPKRVQPAKATPALRGGGGEHTGERSRAPGMILKEQFRDSRATSIGQPLVDAVILEEEQAITQIAVKEAVSGGATSGKWGHKAERCLAGKGTRGAPVMAWKKKHGLAVGSRGAPDSRVTDLGGHGQMDRHSKQVQVLTKVKAIKLSLRRLQREKFLNLSNRIEHTRKGITDIQNLLLVQFSDQNTRVLDGLTSQLKMFLRAEDLMFRQRLKDD